MPDSKKLRKQLLKLWNEDPHCHWCERLTRLGARSGVHLLPDAATLDHLYSRLNPLRRTVNRTMEKRRLLACYECNQRRCREEVAVYEIARKAAEAERRRKYIFSSDDPRLPKDGRRFNRLKESAQANSNNYARNLKTDE